jgi:AcrR family transcriptional regulator
MPAPPTSPKSDLTARGLSTRAKILRAAAEMLAEEGEIEVARVAARAQVSDGLPYRYFESRSGLIAAVVEDFHVRLAEAVVYAEVPGQTWQEREAARVRAWVHFLYADPLSPAVLDGLGGDPVVASSWKHRLALAVEVGTRNIAQGQQAGDIPAGNDPRLLAATVLGGVQAAVAAALAMTPRPPEHHVAAALWTFVRAAAEATPHD